MWFFITFFIGLIGAGIALKYKVPAGAMIGSLFAVAIFSIVTGKAYLPQSYKVIAQISTGAFIGARIKYNDIIELKKVFKPAVIMVVIMALINFIMGYFLYKSSDMDMKTALFCTAPGGIMDMTLIAYDFGADTSKVAVMQMMRLISVMCLIPVLIKGVIRYYKSKSPADNIDIIRTVEEKFIKNEKEKTPFMIDLKKIVITMVIGIISGFIGYFAGIPAGAMSVSMAGVAAYNIKSNKAFMPIKLRQFIQVLGGALIGAKMTMGDLLGLKTIAVPVIIVISGFCLMNLILGIMVYKISDFNIPTSMFSAAPGGISDIAIIAGELGADTPKVAVMQFIRLVSVIAFYPILIKIIIQYF
ncbi:AbrB family transcriptional regulator [Fusobacterium ulcerans]|uniref:AbrB family transcriptional regulator n=1 Tax=Fusobacterium ulcerans TaxID=861 RepID=UPI001032B0F8|nr:AbrB family transcriptional regulator [Fusobacterium ulcerans]